LEPPGHGRGGGRDLAIHYARVVGRPGAVVMNLETVEQRTLSYLMQVSNPLVRVDTLLAHLRDAADLHALDQGVLLDFLRKHELFRVLEAADPEAGPGPFVILETRVPTARQLGEMMVGQVDRMIGALSAALDQALDAGDAMKAGEVQAVLFRAHELRRKLAPGEESEN
jgi:hypothetical protein